MEPICRRPTHESGRKWQMARRAADGWWFPEVLAGKAFLDMLGVFAEFETNLRRERQLEGIAKAKAAGVYKGRPPSIDAAKGRALKNDGLGPSAIATRLEISRQSVYRA